MAVNRWKNLVNEEVFKSKVPKSVGASKNQKSKLGQRSKVRGHGYKPAFL